MAEQAHEVKPVAATPQATPVAAGPGEGLQLESRAGQAGELAAASGAEAQAVAASGVAGAPTALPHQATIQQSFGHHDLSGVQAHVGGPAAGAAAELGANAFALGQHTAFAEAPDLHTAAHEAAHVVQQRGGVQLAGGVGQAGDRYEQHADAVADRVVQGKSAEDLLDQVGGGGANTAVQMDNPPDASTRTTPTRYVVVRGDTLWALSRRFLGDPRRWREIRAANTERVRGDLMRVGAVLTIPPATTPAAPEQDDGHDGQTPAQTATDMLRTSVEAGDGLSAAQTWRTLSTEERGEVAGDGELLHSLLATVPDADAVAILGTLAPDHSRILTLADQRGVGDAAFYRQVLCLVGAETLSGLGSIASDISGLPNFATAAVLDPLLNGPAVTGTDQVVFTQAPGAHTLLETAWPGTFPLDYLRAVAADGPLARESMGSQPDFGAWLLGDTAAFSAWILLQTDAIEWARTLWNLGFTEELAGMINGNPGEWGMVLMMELLTLTASDVQAIKDSSALQEAFLAAIAFVGGSEQVQQAIGVLGLTLPEAIVAVDAAGVLTVELLDALLAAPTVLAADQYAVATDGAAMQLVVDLHPDAMPHALFGLLAADHAAFTDATVKGQVFAGWVAREESVLREVMLAVPDWNGWVKSFVHYSNWALFLAMAAEPAMTTPLRTALLAENAWGWLVNSADKPLADNAQASTLLTLYGDGAGIPLADKYTTFAVIYRARLAQPGNDFVFTWTHSTGSLWWKVNYAHRQAYVAQAPNDAAMDLFFHQFRQLPRSHVDTANTIYMCQFVVHQVTPDDGSAVYYVNQAGQNMAAPGQDPLSTSYYFGGRNCIVMRSLGTGGPTGAAIPDTGRIGSGPATWTDRSPYAANPQSLDPLAGGTPQALTMFQNHATHEVGHAVGNRSLNTGGINMSGDAWTREYSAWRDGGEAVSYSRMLGFTEAMDGTDYTLRNGTTTCTTQGSTVRQFLEGVISGANVNGNELVTRLGSVANAFTALQAHSVLSTNMLVRTVAEVRANFSGIPDNAYYFPFGIPAGPTRVTFFCTRGTRGWSSYDRIAFDNKPSHYAVSSYKEMFAEMYTQKYGGGALPPAIGGKDPADLFRALDTANPADFGDVGSGGGGGATAASPEQAQPQQAPPTTTGPESDGRELSPADRRPWP